MIETHKKTMIFFSLMLCVIFYIWIPPIFGQMSGALGFLDWMTTPPENTVSTTDFTF